MKSPCNNWLLQFRKHLKFKLAFKHHQKLFTATYLMSLRPILFLKFFICMQRCGKKKTNRIYLKKSWWGAGQTPTEHESTAYTYLFIATPSFQALHKLHQSLDCLCWILARAPGRDFITGFWQPPMLHPHFRHSAEDVSTLGMLSTFFLVHFWLYALKPPNIKEREPKNCSFFSLSVASQESHPSPCCVAYPCHYLKRCLFSPVRVCVSSCSRRRCCTETPADHCCGHSWAELGTRSPGNTGGSLTTWAHQYTLARGGAKMSI